MLGQVRSRSSCASTPPSIEIVDCESQTPNFTKLKVGHIQGLIYNNPSGSIQASNSPRRTLHDYQHQCTLGKGAGRKLITDMYTAKAPNVFHVPSRKGA